MGYFNESTNGRQAHIPPRNVLAATRECVSPKGTSAHTEADTAAGLAQKRALSHRVGCFCHYETITSRHRASSTLPRHISVLVVRKQERASGGEDGGGEKRQNLESCTDTSHGPGVCGVGETSTAEPPQRLPEMERNAGLVGQC